MFKNLSIRAVLTTALCVFFALFLVTGIAVYQQPVSYTHLDVYKRQDKDHGSNGVVDIERIIVTMT